jgi:hypothetical protein
MALSMGYILEEDHALFICQHIANFNIRPPHVEKCRINVLIERSEWCLQFELVVIYMRYKLIG